MFEAIVSQAHFAICLRERSGNILWYTSSNVPSPQLWGGQHTEMFVNHVTVFSQSVTRIRLSHTIFYTVTVTIYAALTHSPTCKAIL